jgi:hypothetical protein
VSGWADLAYHGLRVVPWDGPLPRHGGTWARFDSTFTATIQLLDRELTQLNASKVVVELDVSDRDIRLDGFPRANARPISSPAVRVTFESKHGPVRMETAEFLNWQDNLRAIALSLEALRKVDRYGVSKRGEQYRGWRAIPMSTDPTDLISTPEQAQAFLDEHGGTFAEAAKKLHPDKPGGDEGLFRVAVKARDLLGGAV